MSRFVTGLVLLTLVAPVSAADYQKMAAEAKWEWHAWNASLTASCARLNFMPLGGWEWVREGVGYSWAMKQFPGDYQLEVFQNTDRPGGLTFRFLKDDKRLLTFEGHRATGFLLKENVLYYTQYDLSSTGCTLVAFDLANKKELWKTDLKGIGPIQHKKYLNLVALDFAGDAVKVLGQETAGDYIEFVDIKTGKTVGHKCFGEGARK